MLYQQLTVTIRDKQNSPCKGECKRPPETQWGKINVNEYITMVIYQKIVDRSTLRQGFQIPVEFHPLLELIPGGIPCHGETRAIKILIDGIGYEALLKNQGFDRKKYNGHPDVIQVRYNEQSQLAQKLREKFSNSWDYVEHIKSLPENQGRKVTIRVPEEQQELLILTATDLQNVFIVDCITTELKTNVSKEISALDELDFETIELREDKNASIKEMSRLQKVRILDRSIGDSLKRLYGYKCQMTGEKVGGQFGVMVVEAHHIVPFTKSINNNASNIIILSPNYHRVIHKAKAEFDREQLAFVFPNGLIDKVKLNKHII